MKFKLNLVFLSFFIVALTLQSCGTANYQTLWVAGYTTKCDFRVKKENCLYVSWEDTLDNKWTRYSNDILNFSVEEGVLQKIKVKKIKPREGQNEEYKYVKTLQKEPDKRVELDGSWILKSINDTIVSENLAMPSIHFDIRNSFSQGNGGYDPYQADIIKLTPNELSLSFWLIDPLYALPKNLQERFHYHLLMTNYFEVQGDSLFLKDKEQNTTLKFIKYKTQNPLNGHWVLKSIDGKSTKEMGVINPTLNIDLENQIITGNGGTSKYFVEIKYHDANKTLIELEENLILVRTNDVWHDINPNVLIQKRYFEYLKKVSKYKIENNELYFYDYQGSEFLVFSRINYNRNKDDIFIEKDY